MKIYIIRKTDRTYITSGTSKVVCAYLGVTRQALSKAALTGGTVKGYLVETYPYYKQTPKTKKAYLGRSLELLKQARESINEINTKQIEQGEYAYVNIIMRINKLLEETKDLT